MGERKAIKFLSFVSKPFWSCNLCQHLFYGDFGDLISIFLPAFTDTVRLSQHKAQHLPGQEQEDCRIPLSPGDGVKAEETSLTSRTIKPTRSERSFSMRLLTLLRKVCWDNPDEMFSLQQVMKTVSLLCCT